MCILGWKYTIRLTMVPAWFIYPAGWRLLVDFRAGSNPADLVKTTRRFPGRYSRYLTGTIGTYLHNTYGAVPIPIWPGERRVSHTYAQYTQDPIENTMAAPFPPLVAQVGKCTARPSSSSGAGPDNIIPPLIEKKCMGKNWHSETEAQEIENTGNFGTYRRYLPRYQ